MREEDSDARLRAEARCSLDRAAEERGGGCSAGEGAEGPRLGAGADLEGVDDRTDLIEEREGETGGEEAEEGREGGREREKMTTR